MFQPPIKIDVEKIYKIDEVGNVDVERSWIFTNQTSQDVDMSELSFYVKEIVGNLVDATAKDSSGILDLAQERDGSAIKLIMNPRINTLNSHAKYTMTLNYNLANNVNQLGHVWLFSSTISGFDTSSFANLILDKVDFKLQVILPKLKKNLLQNIFYESAPICREVAKGETSFQLVDNKVLEWKKSLFSSDNCRVELIYGIRTNVRLTSFLSATATAISVGLIKLVFDLL